MTVPVFLRKAKSMHLSRRRRGREIDRDRAYRSRSRGRTRTSPPLHFCPCHARRVKFLPRTPETIRFRTLWCGFAVCNCGKTKAARGEKIAADPSGDGSRRGARGPWRHAATRSNLKLRRLTTVARNVNEFQTLECAVRQISSSFDRCTVRTSFFDERPFIF